MRQRDFIRVATFETPRQRLMRIVAAVADEHAVEVGEIMGSCRKRPFARARFDVWNRLRAEGLSYPQIGRMFGRDHSTIVHGVARYNGEGRAWRS